MAFTCYATLRSVELGQLSPPYFTADAGYVIIDALTNTVVTAQTTGLPDGEATVNISPPIASQAAVLAALQTAIQAAETATPALTFIWLEL